MNKITSVLTLFLVCSALSCFSQTASSAAPQEQLEWHTDLAKAQQLSKSENKPIFAFFTGSDWCGWCMKLQRDVFAKPEFVKWAKEKVVLLELDFPRRKQLSPELTQQNQGLQQAFGIQGYPTIWMFFLNQKPDNNWEISALGSLGYPAGSEPGKEEVKFLHDANDILTNTGGK